MNFRQELLFLVLVKQIKKEFTIDVLQNLKTKNGQTQSSELSYIKKIENIINKFNLDYKKAGSQQPYDFRIYLNNSIFLLEIKKTDHKIVKLNDTLPNSNIWYIILFTGDGKNKPKIIAKNGSVFLAKTNWNIQAYHNHIQKLKVKTKQIINKNDCIICYSRPNYSIRINNFL